MKRLTGEANRQITKKMVNRNIYWLLLIQFVRLDKTIQRKFWRETLFISFIGTIFWLQRKLEIFKKSSKLEEEGINEVEKICDVPT